MDPKMTFNPSLQYFAQVVSHKLKNDPERLKKMQEAMDDTDQVPNEKLKLNQEKAQELPSLNNNIREYVRPDEGMFREAEQEIGEFERNFDLDVKEDEEVGMAEKKRVYWKDLIKREEDRLVKMQEEAEAEKLKFGDKDGDDDKKVKEIGSVNPIADFRNIVKDKKVED